MTDLRQAAQQALEALEHHSAIKHPQQIHYRDTAIAALKAALEQQQVAPPPEWPLIKNILAVFGLDAIAFVAEWKAAQRKELSASEILNMMPSAIPAEYDGPLMEFARAIEAKIKERNT